MNKSHFELYTETYEGQQYFKKLDQRNKDARIKHIDSVINSLAPKLKDIRLHLKLTQAEIAERCNLHPTAWAHFENGHRIPSLKNFAKICCLLKININKLLEW